MSKVKELLIDQLQDLLHAEMQLTKALPKMADAAHHPKLQEAFRFHLTGTENQVQRLKDIFDLLGEKAAPKPCKAMEGLIKEGEETIKEGQDRDPLSADLALIAAAQRVEHYEISAYGTARTLAWQMKDYNSARLLSQTLGEEESTDFLLTAIADPILQEVAINDQGGGVNLHSGNKVNASTPTDQSSKNNNKDSPRKK